MNIPVRALLAAAIVLLSGNGLFAQEGIVAQEDAQSIAVDRGASALWLSLKKLHSRASMMMITAHPDDEDGGTLAYVSRGLGGDVALLTLNRGEGGANVMSSDYWDALGLVRTEELLQADRYYGVHQYFSSVVDYGFSKTKEEALTKWGHDRVLYDVVRAVRQFRPLVITSVFVGGPSDGHGNHATAGQMAQEVFKLAGDPNVFPDQIKAGLLPWNPLKEYARVPFSLRKETLSPKGLYDYATHHWAPAGVQNYISGKFEPGAVTANIEIATGEYDPVAGRDYVQTSREGLGFQKSQNGGIEVPPAGPDTSDYHRFGSRIEAAALENSFFEGIDTSLPGIATLAGRNPPAFLTEKLVKINASVEEAIKEFAPARPADIAPILAKGMLTTEELIHEVEGSNLSQQPRYDVLHELEIKRSQWNDALLQSLGISLLPTIAPDRENQMERMFRMTPASFAMAIPGQSFSVNVHVANEGPLPISVEQIHLAADDRSSWNIHSEGALPTSLAAASVCNQRFRVTVPEDAGYTRPYFSRPNLEQPYYDLLEPSLRGRPLKPYPLSAWIKIKYEGVSLQASQIVQTATRQTGYGVVLRPMPVGPALSISIAPSAGVIAVDRKSLPVSVHVHSNIKGQAQGVVRLDLPSGWRSEPASMEYSFTKDGEDRNVTFTVFPSAVEEKPYEITAVAEWKGKQYKEGYTTVGYSGLRPYFLYRSATYRLSGVAMKIAPDIEVGYVEGSGDEVAQSIANLGVGVHFLLAQDLAAGDLSRYKVIVLGVRAYAVRSDLVANNSRLLDYVKNGGILIVQYNTPEFDHNYGPYPYVMTSDPEEVTDEASTIQLLDNKNPIFTWPNTITTRDFEGWVEERGSKFLNSWDPHYQALLETHDPEQDPQKGGLIYTQYGKGVYIYNAYAFYRQLPEGVPGAYRIFANMLSLPDNPGVRGEASK